MQFLRVHLDLVVQADPTALVVGINPSASAEHPFDATTPSGELVQRFLRTAPRDARIMIWNVCAGLTFTRGRRDLSYDVVVQEERDLVAQVHLLNLEFISHASQHMPALTRIIALGKNTLMWLQQVALPSQVVVVGTAHPAHYLRLQPPRPEVFLRFMTLCIDPSAAPESHESRRVICLEPSIIPFCETHINIVRPRAIMKLFSLPAELQRAVAWQGSLNKPRIFCDPTAVLIGRIQKAHAADPASVSQLLALDDLQEHIVWQFMELNASTQRLVMSRSLDGCRSKNAVLQYRMSKLSSKR